MILHSHYKVIAETARAYDLTLYGEGLESIRYFLGDDMNFRRYADVPTEAMWIFSPEVGPQPDYSADIRGAASVAHVYGKEFVAAEFYPAGDMGGTSQRLDKLRGPQLLFVTTG